MSVYFTYSYETRIITIERDKNKGSNCRVYAGLVGPLKDQNRTEKECSCCPKEYSRASGRDVPCSESADTPDHRNGAPDCVKTGKFISSLAQSCWGCMSV